MPPDGGSFWTSLPGILTALAGLLGAVGTLVGVLRSSAAKSREARTEETTPDAGRTSNSGSPSAPMAVTTEPAAQRDVPPSGPPNLNLRSAPALLSSEKMDVMLVRLGLFDKRRNPAGRGVSHSYQARADGQTPVVHDDGTGLTWELGGSAREVRFDEIAGLIDKLNADRVGGSADWRIPTAEEAMTLMEPEPTDGFHIARVFRRGINFIWTADQVPGGERAWVVYFADGTIETESREFNAWVKAVH